MEHLSYDVFRSVFTFPSGGLNLRMTFGMNDMMEINVLTAPLQPGVDEIRFHKLSD
jgi:hypothetical protein